MEENEYIKAQILAVEGYSLDKVDVRKAIKDKVDLAPALVNRSVEKKIDAYLESKVTAIDAAELAIKAEAKKVVTKVVKKKEEK